MTCGCEEHEMPRLLAHCGGNEKFIENAKSGFEYSLANGVTGFETDFRMSGDGVILVIHDSDLKRTTTGEGAVEHKTLEEIKKVKLLGLDESVPTAEEVFSLFDNRKGFFIELEMKARYGELYSFERMDEYLEKLHALAVKHLSNGTFIFTSFDVPMLKRMKELHSDARVGIICGPLTDETIDDAIAIKAYSIAATLDGTDVATVKRAKAAGLKINLWHAETIELWQKAKEMGADVCTSNHSVAVLKEIRSRNA